MNLQQAAKSFVVQGLDPENLKGQEEAFQRCVLFLAGMKKTKTQNNGHTSYGLKHTVERAYDCYVYEGTFLLAAMASGFVVKPYGQESMSSTLNISEINLRELMEDGQGTARLQAVP